MSSGNLVEVEFEVQEILDERKVDGVLEYKIKWKDGPGRNENWSDDKYDEWKRKDELDCPDLMKAYRKKKAAEARKPTGGAQPQLESSGNQNAELACPICGAASISMKRRKNHIKKKHPEEYAAAKEAEKGGERKRIKCDLCSKECATPAGLANHKRKSHGSTSAMVDGDDELNVTPHRRSKKILSSGEEEIGTTPIKRRKKRSSELDKLAPSSEGSSVFFSISSATSPLKVSIKKKKVDGGGNDVASTSKETKEKKEKIVSSKASESRSSSKDSAGKGKRATSEIDKLAPSSDGSSAFFATPTLSRRRPGGEEKREEEKGKEERGKRGRKMSPPALSFSLLSRVKTEEGEERSETTGKKKMDGVRLTKEQKALDTKEKRSYEKRQKEKSREVEIRCEIREMGDDSSVAGTVDGDEEDKRPLFRRRGVVPVVKTEVPEARAIEGGGTVADEETEEKEEDMDETPPMYELRRGNVVKSEAVFGGRGEAKGTVGGEREVTVEETEGRGEDMDETPPMYELRGGNIVKAEARESEETESTVDGEEEEDTVEEWEEEDTVSGTEEDTVEEEEEEEWEEVDQAGEESEEKEGEGEEEGRAADIEEKMRRVKQEMADERGEEEKREGGEREDAPVPPETAVAAAAAGAASEKAAAAADQTGCSNATAAPAACAAAAADPVKEVEEEQLRTCGTATEAPEDAAAATEDSAAVAAAASDQPSTADEEETVWINVETTSGYDNGGRGHVCGHELVEDTSGKKRLYLKVFFPHLQEKCVQFIHDELMMELDPAGTLAYKKDVLERDYAEELEKRFPRLIINRNEPESERTKELKAKMIESIRRRNEEERKKDEERGEECSDSEVEQSLVG